MSDDDALFDHGKRKVTIMEGSSPNYLIEYFIKIRQGIGRKGRGRRKHRRDIRFPNPTGSPSAQHSGGGKVRRIEEHLRPSLRGMRAS